MILKCIDICTRLASLIGMQKTVWHQVGCDGKFDEKNKTGGGGS